MFTQFFKTYRNESIIFSVAFFLRIFFFFIFLYFSFINQFDFPVIGSDSRLYMESRESFLMYRKFLNLDTLAPMDYILPGYPLFLTAVMGVASHVWAVPFVQYILAALSAVLIYRVGLLFSNRVAWTAAFLFVFDPAGIFYSSVILTETLFIFFLSCALFFLTTRNTMLSSGALLPGVLLGAGMLVRPAGIILIPGVIVFFIIVHKKDWRRLCSAMALFLIGFSLLTAPWLIRNKLLFNQWEISPVASLQYYAAHAPLFYAWREGIPEKEAILFFRDRLIAASPYGDAAIIPNAPYMRRVAFDYIGEHPWEFTLFHAIKTIPLFISDGLRDIAERVHLIAPSSFSITDLLLRGDTKTLRMYFSDNPLSLLLLGIGSLSWFLITLCAFYGIARTRRETGIRQAFLFMSIVFILASIVAAGGATSHPRYRHSMSPYLFLLSAYGFWRVLDFRKKKLLNKAIS